MKNIYHCPRCGNKKSWAVRRNKRKCSECRYEWQPRRLPLNLTRAQWKRMLRWFVLGQSSARIALESGIGKNKVLGALTLVREAMIRDIPPIFEGTVEVDETYLGGAWKNKRKSVRARGAKRGRGTSKQAVFGILCRGGKVWAEIVPDVGADTLLPLIRKRVKKGATVCSDTFRSYTGVAARGYVHRMVRHDKQVYSDNKGNHINGLEGFWGYLKRMLTAKGGIREERLPYYLAEYVWRYNNRDLTDMEKIRSMLSLVEARYKSGG